MKTSSGFILRFFKLKIHVTLDSVLLLFLRHQWNSTDLVKNYKREKNLQQDQVSVSCNSLSWLIISTAAQF